MNATGVGIAFFHPAAGWLFALLPLFWWWARGGAPRWQRALRSAIFAILVLAVMQPSLVHPSGRVTRVVVLDQRPILSAAQRARARALLAAVLAHGARDERVTLLQFGGGAPVAARVARRANVDGASLSVALREAVAALPPERGNAVTLIVDPRSTDRHWSREVAALRARGTRVDVAPLDASATTPLIAAVAASAPRVGEQAEVTIDVEGSAPALGASLFDGDRLVARAAPVTVADGHRFTLAFTPDRARFVPLTAVLTGAAGPASRLRRETILAVQPPLSLLYLGGRQAGAAPLLQRLLGPAFAVEARDPSTIGANDPARYGAVVVDDLPANRLPQPAQRALLDAVAGTGTGLVYTGGRAAFGPGGYAGAPLAAALPVRARQEDRIQQPSVALAIVIDSSGSMTGRPMDLAKQVARLAVKRLGPADSIGVVEFYGARQWSVPMQPATRTADVERAIGRMQANGSSVLYPAIQEAYYGLKNVKARYRHILIVSDGGVEEDRYTQLLRHIADDRINVSTALIGGDTGGEENMVAWARVGRGRFYAIPDEFSMVDLNLKQPQNKPGTGYAAAGTAVDVRGGWPWWRGIDLTRLPPLAGHALATTRPDAETLLATGGGDPLLASWQYGAGRVTALMTEPLGEGTASWRGWPRYGEWLGRIVARSARQAPALDLRLFRRFDRLTVIARTADTTRTDPPTVWLAGASGARAPVSLEARAPGVFEAELPFPSDRPALVEGGYGEVTARAGDAAGSDIVPVAAMARAKGLPLARLATTGGGVVVSGPDDARAIAALAGARGGGEVATALWHWLPLLAMLLYMLELVCRRWPWPPRGKSHL